MRLLFFSLLNEMAASDPNLYEFELTFKSLYDAKTPVSRSKIYTITDLAIKAQKYYKHVVMHIETFIRKSSPKHKLPGVYVIDSIVRLSQRHYGKERDVFGKRFAKNLETTYANAAKCADEDRLKVFRCFKLWKENGFFDDDTIAPIVANIQAVESFEESGTVKTEKNDENTEVNVSNISSSPEKELVEKESPVKEKTKERDASPSGRSGEKVRFDKRLLDFDYSDDEEGQTSERGGKRTVKKESDDEDYFVMGKNGKPEFSVDKIMMGLRKQRGGSEEPGVAVPVAAGLEGSGLMMPNVVPVAASVPVSLPPENATAPVSSIPESTTIILKSCTIWIGHLTKGVVEMDLKRDLTRYGEIKSFDLIPSRGCAYVSYAKRSEAEAARASTRDLWKSFGEKVKVSWSPGKGIKDGYKSWDWDSFTGICRIPVDKLPLSAKGLVEGSELVDESVPSALKSRFFDKESADDRDKLADISLPAAPLPVLPLPVVSSVSGWQTSATIGFDPKINPWTAFANQTNTQLQVGNALLLPPLPTVPGLPPGAVAPGPRLPGSVPGINPLLLSSGQKGPNPGPFTHNISVPPPQPVLAIPSLSNSISSLVNVLPAAISALNGASLPTSWSDPAPLKVPLQNTNEPMKIADQNTPVAPLAPFLGAPPPSVMGAPPPAGMFPPAPTGPGFQRPPPNFRPPLLAPPPDIAARLAMITRMGNPNAGNPGNLFGKGPSDQNGDDNQQHHFKPPFRRTDSSPEKSWNNRQQFRQPNNSFNNKRFDGPRFERDQRGDRNFSNQGGGRFNTSRPFHGQRGFNPR